MKRICIVAIAIIMTVSALTGCNQIQQPRPVDTATNPLMVTVRPSGEWMPEIIISSTPTPGPQPEYKAVDLKGRTIRISNSSLYRLFWRKREIEQKYNCTLLTETFFDSSVVTDIVIQENGYMFYTDRVENISEKPLQLDQYAEMLDLDNKLLWDTDRQEFQRFGQDTLVVAYKQKAENLFGDGSEKVLLFNKTMLENAGLWDRYNLYWMQQEKEWTWETFKTLCQEISKTGDKKGILFSYYLIDRFVMSNAPTAEDTLSVEMNEKGEITGLKKEEYKKALQLFADLSAEGCIRPQTDFFLGAPNPDEARNSFFEGKDLFYVANSRELGGREDYPINFAKKMANGDEIGMVFFPLGPDNVDRQYYMPQAGPIGYVNRDAEKPEELLCILRELAILPKTEGEMMNDRKTELLRQGFSQEFVSAYEYMTNNGVMTQYSDGITGVENKFYTEANELIRNQKTDAENVVDSVISSGGETDMKTRWKEYLDVLVALSK